MLIASSDYLKHGSRSNRTYSSARMELHLHPFGVYADSYSGSGSREYSSGSAIEPTAPSTGTGPHCPINYFSAFPCTDLDFEEATSEREALQILRTCDVFAFVAAELAVQHVNQHRLGIFTYPSAELPGNTSTWSQTEGQR